MKVVEMPVADDWGRGGGGDGEFEENFFYILAWVGGIRILGKRMCLRGER